MERQLPHNTSGEETNPDRTIKLSDSEISEAGKSARRMNAERRVKFLDADIEGLKSTLNAGASALSNIFSFARETFLPDFKVEEASTAENGEAPEHITEVKQLNGIEAAETIDISKLPKLEDCYKIIREFANGGQGILYKARDNALHRIVALKSLRKELIGKAAVYEAFITEAMITAQLDHPSIVSIYNLLRDDTNGIHLAMKLVRGKDLRTYLNEVSLQFSMGKVSTKLYYFRLPRRLEMFLKVCDALAYAHSRSIIHCDLKPENIMLGEYGEVYVMDWGIARNLRNAKGEPVPQQDGKPLDGTPRFIPPEAFAGRHRDERADIYALGLILYEILTLQHAHDGSDTKAVIRQIKNNERRPVRHKYGQPIPSDLVAIVEKASAYDPEDRYQSVPELSRDIQRYLANEAVEAAPDGIIGGILRWLTRHSRSVVLIGVAGWLIAALVAAHGARSELSEMTERAKIQALQLRQEQKRHDEQDMLRRVSELDGAAVQNAMAISNRMAVLANNLMNFSLNIQAILELPGKLSSTHEMPAYPYLDFEKPGTAASAGPYAPAYGAPLNVNCVSYFSPAMADSDAGVPPGFRETLDKLSPILPQLREIVYASEGKSMSKRDTEKIAKRMCEEGLLMQRAFISLNNPVLQITFPGHGNYSKDYDPRKRPWYEECIAHARKNRFSDIYWSEPYADPTDHDMVMTCAVPIYAKDSPEFHGVVAFDLNFDRFRRFIMRSGITDPAIVDAKYLMTRDGLIAGSFPMKEDVQKMDISSMAKKELINAFKDASYGHCVIQEDGLCLQYHFAFIPVLRLYVIERSTIEDPRKRRAAEELQRNTFTPDPLQNLPGVLQ